MVTKLREWLERHALEQHCETLEDNSVGLDILADLTDAELARLGLNLGDRKRMLRAAAELRPCSDHPDRARAHDTPAALLEPTHSGEQRRQVSLLIADLVGSTELATSLDLEIYRDKIRIYQDTCLAAVRRYQGHVAQLIGDGVTAHFGYPIAREDDAERAVLAGLEICRQIASIEGEDALRVRVGVSTGDVIVDERLVREGLALGDVPNLASRIQAVAEPGTVVVSERTRNLLGSNFVCQPRGEHTLKGFSSPEKVWSVRDVDETELRFRAHHGRSFLPLVNREAEMGLLEGRWQASLDGNGQMVLISGEAGIGKSRLAAEVCDRVFRKGSQYFSFQCHDSYRGSTLHPVISFFAHEAKISRSDGAETKLEKLVAFLSRWGEAKQAEKLIAAVASLLSVPDEMTARFLTFASPGPSKDEIQEAIVSFFVELSKTRDILLLFEDLHWIDPSTEQLLDLMVARLETTRLMVICTCRPDYASRWTGLARVTSISISRLDNRDSHALMRSILSEGAVPGTVEERILSKAGGVPLFIEELSIMCGQRYRHAAASDVDETLALPATLKDLLRSKIDSLGSARNLVPVCAAIGRTITAPMIQQVCNLPAEETRVQLELLVERQILIPRGTGDDRHYTFRHTLIQDAGYEILLPSDRQKLHRRIAEVMAGSEFADDYPDVLAQQYAGAHMPEQACDAFEKAADLAMKRAATEETINHLRASLAQNAVCEGTRERHQKEIGLRKKMNIALNIHSFLSEEARENMAKLRDLLRTEEIEVDTSDRFMSMHDSYAGFLMTGDPGGARAICEDLHELARGSGNPAMTALSAHDRGMAEFMLGNFSRALKSFDRALELRRGTNAEDILRLNAADVRIVDIAMQCWARTLAGSDEKSAGLEKGVSLTRMEAHEFSRCYALNILATAYQSLENLGAVAQLTEESREISRQRKFVYWDAWGSILHGWTRARQGDHGGLLELQQGIREYRATGMTQILLYAGTLLADAYLSAGDLPQARDALTKVREGEKTNFVRYQKAFTDAVESRLKERAVEA